MKNHGFARQKHQRSGSNQKTLNRAVLGALLTLATLAMAGQDQDKSGISVSVQGKDGSDSGLVISAQATAKEAGLPVYPGARPHKDQGEDSSAAKVGLWGKSSGFKLVVLKMESDDPPAKVASFYRKALAKYGTVLDCGDTSTPESQKEKNGSSGSLSCEDDRPDPGGMLFKAGSREKQHIVGIKPNGTGAVFALIYLEDRGQDK